MKRATIQTSPRQRIAGLIGLDPGAVPLDKAITGGDDVVCSFGVGIVYKFAGDLYIYADQDHAPAVNAHIAAAHEAARSAGYVVRDETTDYQNDRFQIYRRSP